MYVFDDRKEHFALKILVAGNGNVGRTLVSQLSAEGYDLTLIDKDSQLLEESVEKFDVMAVNGNCASMDTLRDADVENADLLIACTGMDELNLLCCMTAHVMNPNIHTIARIRNPEYTEQAYAMRSSFGLSMIFNPERQAATEIERLLKYPGFLKRDSFAKGRVEIVELGVTEGSKLCNVALNGLNAIVKCKVLVCTVLRDGKAIMPDGHFVLAAGDKIFVTAPSENLSKLLKNIGLVKHKARRVMIAGGGMIAHYLAESLLKQKIDVQIVEQDADRCRTLASLVPEASIIHGDAGNQALLEREGLASCDALITLTGSDEKNMVISLYGNSCEVPQVITMLGSVEDARVIDSLPLGSIICPRKLCCNNIVRYVRAMQNQAGAATTIHTIADGQAEAIEFPVDSSTLHCGEPLKKLKLKKNILVVGITRRGRTEIPNGDSFFEEGDSIVIVVNRDDVILQVNDIFE